MSFQVIVREIKPALAQVAREPSSTEAVGCACSQRGDQIYEQNVESLDLSKVIAAVNFKPRLRKARATAAVTPRS